MMNEYNLKRELKRLSSIRGSGTELISIYVPNDYSLSDEIGKLGEDNGREIGCGDTVLLHGRTKEMTQ